jgi:pilus assembly protein Flp/PilA
MRQYSDTDSYNVVLSVFGGANRFGSKPMARVVEFLKDDSGATAIEYGLIAAGISIVIVVAVNSIGSTLNTTFTSVSTQLK